jgi:hypothetical protein
MWVEGGQGGMKTVKYEKVEAVLMKKLWGKNGH